MKATIIHLTCQHCSFDDRIFYKEARSLSNQYDVILLANSPDKMIRDMSGKVMECGTFENVRQETYTLSKNKYLQFAKMRMPALHASIVIKKIESLNVVPKIIHFHDLELLPVARYLQKRFKCKLIFDVHEMFPAYPQDRNRFPLSDLKSYFIFRMMKFHFKYLDAVVSTSEPIWILNSLFNIDIPNVRIFNTSIFSGSQPEAKETEREKIVLVHEGSLPFNRGLTLMCDIFRDEWIRKYVELKIVGRLKGLEKEYLMKRMESEPWLKDCIKITGWVEYLELPNYLSGDIGIIFFERKYNNMSCIPNKLFNYIAAGLPVISTHTPAISPIIERYGLGISVTRRPEVIKQAIMEIIGKNQKYKNKVKEMGSILNWAHDEKKLLNLYDGLIKS